MTFAIECLMQFSLYFMVFLACQILCLRTWHVTKIVHVEVKICSCLCMWCDTQKERKKVWVKKRSMSQGSLEWSIQVVWMLVYGTRWVLYGTMLGYGTRYGYRTKLSCKGKGMRLKHKLCLQLLQREKEADGDCSWGQWDSKFERKVRVTRCTTMMLSLDRRHQGWWACEFPKGQSWVLMWSMQMMLVTPGRQTSTHTYYCFSIEGFQKFPWRLQEWQEWERAGSEGEWEGYRYRKVKAGVEQSTWQKKKFKRGWATSSETTQAGCAWTPSLGVK